MNHVIPTFDRVLLMGGVETIDRKLKEQGNKLKPFRYDGPVGSKGRWTVSHFTIPEQSLAVLRAVRDGGRGCAPGQYSRLLRDKNTIVMTDTDAEMIDFLQGIREIKGRVLMGGLGLGLAVKALLMLDTVSYIEVVELDQDLIDLVGPHYKDPRLRIVQGDIFKYRCERNVTKFDWAWYDIWDTISDDNLPEMRRLRRRFANRMSGNGKQLCWAEKECRLMKRGIDPRYWYQY
jgi:hypothetical protein